MNRFVSIFEIIFKLLIVTCIPVFSNTQTANFTKLVSELGKSKRFEFEFIGRGSSTSETYLKYKTLLGIADTGQLLTLINNSNPIIRCYAAFGLIDKKYSKIDKVFEMVIKHDAYIESQRVDLIDKSPLSELVYYRYLNSVPRKSRPKDSVLFLIDSMILTSCCNNNQLIFAALDNRIFPKRMISTIENLADTKLNIHAINYLAKWNRAEYSAKIDSLIILHLQSTKIHSLGSSGFYNEIAVLIELDRALGLNHKSFLIQKMKSDNFWEIERERFIYLLYSYSISEDDLK